MSIQKRRIIYMTDEEWARLLERAAAEGTTVSAIVRDAVTKPKRGSKRAD